MMRRRIWTDPEAAHRLAARQRVRSARQALAMVVALLVPGLLLAAVAEGKAAAGPVYLFLATAVAGALAWFAWLRLGRSPRAGRPAAPVVPQLVFALVCTVWAYALAGPARGALLVLLPLVLGGGLHALDSRTVLRLAALGAALLGGVAGSLAWRYPEGHPWRVELAHWVFASLAMAAVTVANLRVGRMRQRLRGHQAELAAALVRIQALAMRDSLTGLLNRRAMLDELKAEAKRAQRTGQAMSVALVDMDHFKAINDTHGQGVGDRVLQRFAEVAREELRDTDRLARWGSEEFLVLLPQCSMVQAAALLERIRARLREATMDGVSRELRITFSAGLARCDGRRGVETAVELAEAAKNRAKSGGRNRTECAPTLSSA